MQFFNRRKNTAIGAKKLASSISRLVPLCLFLFASSFLAAQYKIETWTTEQGLPYKIVNSVVQTQDGYVWAATDDGLARFDGVRFTVFNTANTKNLPTNRVQNLVETTDGSLWMASENRGLIRYRDGEFRNYTIADGLPDDGNLLLVFVSPQNFLRVITKKGAARFDGEKFVRESIGSPPFDNKNPPHIDNAGAFWVNEGDKLRRFGNGGEQQIFPLPKTVSIRRHLKPYQDSAGNFWVSADRFLLRFADGKTDVFSPKDGLPEDFVIMIFEDSRGNVWFGSQIGGLSVFIDGKFKLLTEKDGLISQNINHIAEDREGGIWVGTDGGLLRLSPQIIRAFSTADGLTGDNIYPLMEDAGGAVWIGSWLGIGLDKYEDGKFTGVRTLGHLNTALFQDRDGIIWVGSHNHFGKVENGKFMTVVSQPGMVIRAITQDRDGRLWFGDERGELWRFRSEPPDSISDLGMRIADLPPVKRPIPNPKSQIPNREGGSDIFTPRDGLPSGGIYNLHEDRSGILWIGTSGGLAKYENGRFTVFTETDGLSGNYVRSIYEDADGTLWLGTFDNGITRLKDGKFSAIRVSDGLHDNGAFQILEDDFGRFWISSNRGIYRVARRELNDFADGKIASVTSVAYGVRDGMLDAECNGGVSPAGFKSRRDGRLWFPTQKGVVVIDPKNLPVSEQPPNVVIENVLIDRKLSEPPASAGDFSRAVDTPADAGGSDALKILPENDALEIQYTGLSFVKPEQIKFKYKLEGLDENWVEAGTRRTAYFAHLPPGDYTFRVAAANVDGVWNEAGATLKISVVPPFYRTFWFLAACVVVAFGLVAFVFSSRIRSLEKARHAQEEFSRKLLASQESERQRIAGELHDSLGQELLIIKNWALLALSNGKDSSEQLSEISETASQAIDEVREIAYNLRPFHLDELGLTKAIEAMLDRVSKSTKINFAAEIDSVDGFFPKEAEINFYRVIQECVNNIVKHSGAGAAAVKIKRSDGSLRLSISDDGRGFDAGEISASARRARQSGFGLAGIGERARILGGKLVVNSSPEKGTVVSLTVTRNEKV